MWPFKREPELPSIEFKFPDPPQRNPEHVKIEEAAKLLKDRDVLQKALACHGYCVGLTLLGRNTYCFGHTYQSLTEFESTLPLDHEAGTLVLKALIDHINKKLEALGVPLS